MDAGEAVVVRPAMQILMMRPSARPTPQVKGTCVPPRLPDPLVSTWAMEVWLSAGKMTERMQRGLAPPLQERFLSDVIRWLVLVSHLEVALSLWSQTFRYLINVESEWRIFNRNRCIKW